MNSGLFLERIIDTIYVHWHLIIYRDHDCLVFTFLKLAFLFCYSVSSPSSAGWVLHCSLDYETHYSTLTGKIIHYTHVLEFVGDVVTGWHFKMVSFGVKYVFDTYENQYINTNHLIDLPKFFRGAASAGVCTVNILSLSRNGCCFDDQPITAKQLCKYKPKIRILKQKVRSQSPSITYFWISIFVKDK